VYFDTATAIGPASELARGTWILDPDRSEEFEIEASAEVDQRKLGMTYSPLGTLRPPRASPSAAASPAGSSVSRGTGGACRRPWS
jgi:hypothetical protein